MAIVEFFTFIIEIMVLLISPEKTAEKVKDIKTNRTTKAMIIFLFTLIYVVILLGLAFSLTILSDIVYKVLAVILIMFLIYFIFIFYYRIFRD